MIPIHPYIPIDPHIIHVRAEISSALHQFPVALTDIVADYAADFDYSLLLTTDLMFDHTGCVANPRIRELVKEAFMSTCCSPDVKTALMIDAYHPLLEIESPYYPRRQQELEIIFKEIAVSGYRIMFDNVDLSNLELVDTDWTGISLRGANLSGTSLVHVEMPFADLTGALVDGGAWVDVNLKCAILSDTDLNTLAVRQRIDLSYATGLTQIPDIEP